MMNKLNFSREGVSMYSEVPCLVGGGRVPCTVRSHVAGDVPVR